MSAQTLDWRGLLAPYTEGLPLSKDALDKLAAYLDLLLRWNARTNLTAVRDPVGIVQRQIGESLFGAQGLPQSGGLLDFGSGAGFPGIPIAAARPGLTIVLAESQGKKASFLREAVRVLGLQATVWAGRVEDLPEGKIFDAVTMRAVDSVERMLPLAQERVSAGGALLLYAGSGSDVHWPPGWDVSSRQIPLSKGSLLVARREAVFHVEHGS